jgi:zinc transporter, ZIP family
MVEAAFFAGLAALGLVVGFAIAQWLRPADSIVGLFMGLGAGLLMAVVAYSLVEETIEASESPGKVGVGIAAGALTYFFGDLLISKMSGGDGRGGSGLSLALGAVLDGIPESLVIGISVALTGKASIPLVIAAFIANSSESLGASPELESQGMPPRKVALIWIAILGASILASVFGYEVVARMASSGGAIFNGFAGGAVLMVLANAMIPEGYEKAGQKAGLLVVLGFAIGFVLEHF